MITAIDTAISKQCWKNISAANRSSYFRNKKRREYGKVTDTKPAKASGRLPIWQLHPQFHPFQVKKRVHTYATQVAKAIANFTYQPLPCVNIDIPKDNGSTRTISQYSVVDAAVSCWLYESLLTKNSAKLSDFAFAFRRDKNGTDAVQMLWQRIRGRARTFCVEIDFRNCFGEINHKYLLRVLENHFDLSKEEFAAVKALLMGKYARGYQNYSDGIFKPRLTGIPQGSTLSLFLANAVFIELDRALELLGVTFARYADDIVILAETYDMACAAANLIHDFSAKSGIPINAKKSAGVSLISNVSCEIKTKNYFEFLGYRISPNDVRLSQKRKSALKATLSEIINRRLLIHPRKKDLSKKRFFGGSDWDLVVCINELRRRIYGRNLLEEDLSKDIDHTTQSPRSLVSAHALVNVDSDYFELDGWLQGALTRAIKQRSNLVKYLKVNGIVVVTRKGLTSGDWYKHETIKQDMRLPSLIRAWSYARRVLENNGTSSFETTYDDY